MTDNFRIIKPSPALCIIISALCAAALLVSACGSSTEETNQDAGSLRIDGSLDATPDTDASNDGDAMLVADASVGGDARVEGLNLIGSPAHLQTAAGQVLADPIVVLLLDEAGLPRSSIEVLFDPNGGGSVVPQRVLTGIDGQASTLWTLGPGIGKQTLVVSAVGTPATISVEATALGPTITPVQGNEQTGNIGVTLPVALAAIVRSPAGAPLADTIVYFRVSEGGGTVGAPTATSDAQGRVEQTWTLGTTAVPQKVELRLEDGNMTPPLATFIATAVDPSKPAQLVKTSGDSQSVPQYVRLPIPLGLKVTNGNGVALLGITVRYDFEGDDIASVLRSTSVLSPEVQWAPAVPNTEAPGLPNRELEGYFMTVGEKRITVTVQGIPAVTFTVNVIANEHPWDGPYYCYRAGAPNNPDKLYVVSDVVTKWYPLWAGDPLTTWKGAVSQTGELSYNGRAALTRAESIKVQLAKDSNGKITGTGVVKTTPIATTNTYPDVAITCERQL